MFSDFYHIASIISLFLGASILFRRQKEFSHYVLAIWLILLGSNVFLFHRLIDHKEQIELLSLVNYFLFVIQMPAPLIYVSSYYESKQKILSKLLLYVLLPLLIVAFIIVSRGTSVLLVTQTPDFFSVLLYVYLILAYPTYLILSLLKIRKLRRLSLQQHSDFVHSDFIVIRRFVYGLFAAFFAFFTLYLLTYRIEIVSLEAAFGSSIVMLSMAVIYAGIFGMQNSDLFNVKFKSESARKRCAYSEEILEETMRKLDNCMIKQKPYLHPRLSLKELSQITQIPENLISHSINRIRNKNFYEYVNGLRIQTFVERCKTSDRFNYTLMGIAFECGFNSKSTFYEIFKKEIGVTPLVYLKSIDKN